MDATSVVIYVLTEHEVALLKNAVDSTMQKWKGVSKDFERTGLYGLSREAYQNAVALSNIKNKLGTNVHLLV